VLARVRLGLIFRIFRTLGPGPVGPALASQAGKVKVTATSMSELTYGIGRYTRFVCNLTVGWPRGGGSSNATGLSWPCTASMMPMAMGRAVPYTYMDNVCTHSYSYVWYDEEDWVRHIDWMALSGINVFLAMTGQEEVQYKAFRQFGLEDQDIREFFNGLHTSRGPAGSRCNLWAPPQCPKMGCRASHARGCKGSGSCRSRYLSLPAPSA